MGARICHLVNICDSNQTVSGSIVHSHYEEMPHWGKGGKRVRGRAQLQRLSNQPTDCRNPLPAAISSTTSSHGLLPAADSAVHFDTHCAIAKCSWQSDLELLFVSYSATLYLLDFKHKLSFSSPHTLTHTSFLLLKTRGNEDAISSWYTILPNWREITVSGTARRTASRKTMDGPRPN